ncbi:MAG: hypothetical protein MJ051_06775 [Akkermansia sp.]|nr:hypothetical protein [Akkermansia sp.]
MEQVQPHKHIAYICYAPDVEAQAVAERLTRFLKEFRVPHQLRRLNRRTPATLATVTALPCDAPADLIAGGKFLVLVGPASDSRCTEGPLISYFGLKKAGEDTLSAEKAAARLSALSHSKKERVIPVAVGHAGERPVLSPVLASLGIAPVVVTPESEAASFRSVAAKLLGAPTDAPWEAWERHRKPHHAKRVALLSCAAVGVAAVALFGGIYFAPTGEAEERVENAELTYDASAVNEYSLKQGDVHHVYERDVQGRVISVSAQDASGMPCPDVNGVCCTRYGYDAQGRVVSKRFYDEDDKPCINKDGYAEMRTAYDERGLVTSQSFFDVHGEVAFNASGYAEVRFAYDNRSNMVSQSFHDEEGALLDLMEGYSTLLISYDEEGHMLSQCYRNAKGEPVRCPEGYAEVRAVYDNQGNMIAESYYNAVGEPCANADGYYRVEYVYDEHGHRVSSVGVSEL